MLSLPHGRVLLVVGWVLVISIVVGRLAPMLPNVGVKGGDKIMHLLAYFGLTLWFSGLYPLRQLWVIALGFFLLGATLEVLQAVLTAHRQMDIRDLAANTMGIAAASFAAIIGVRQWAERLESWLTRRTVRQE